MFSVIFEILPNDEKRDVYLDAANSLYPRLQQIEGFADSEVFQSLTREGWLVSLSSWRNEKALVRWRTQEDHYFAQESGRRSILADYRMRVGQIIADNQTSEEKFPVEKCLEETASPLGTAITLITGKRPADWTSTTNPYDCAGWLGLDPRAANMVTWDIFEAVHTPGDLLLLVSWADMHAAEVYEDHIYLRKDIRLRRAQIVRDYSKYERFEAPQYFPAVETAIS